MGSEERLQAVKIISGVVDGLGLRQARLETAAGNGGSHSVCFLHQQTTPWALLPRGAANAPKSAKNI